jgi:uncharacterized protein
MKLQPDKSNAPMIQACCAQWIQVDALRHTRSLVLHSHRHPATQDWAPESFSSLCPADFLIESLEDCELVVFGSGIRMRFVPASWTGHLFERRIGFECMDTAAACRTYNILASEGRKVTALLLVEGHVG